MSDDKNHEALLMMPNDFPYQNLRLVGEILKRSDVFVWGYIPPPDGLYDPDGFIREDRLHGVKTVLLPDRNIVSRLAQVAKGEPLDEHRRLAAAVLAFAQGLDIHIEPSIAFHELAPKQGNGVAHDELAWFRAADHGNVHDWIAMALGQVSRIPAIGTPAPLDTMDLAKPLRRWRQNYVVALQIGELELSNLSPLERVLSLFHWMYHDFNLAGPAAMLACIYLAPNTPGRRRLFKDLKVADREKAIQGARNAAWDITQVSDFVSRINAEPQERPRRFILATIDVGLRSIARLAVSNSADMTDTELANSLALALQQWWPARDARKIAETLVGYIVQTRHPDWWKKFEGRPNYVGELTARGEAVIRSWTASTIDS